MDNFLPLLKKQRSFQPSVPGGKEEIYFCIHTEDTSTYLTVTDKNEKEIQVDYRGYSGDTFNVLRSLEAIDNKNVTRFTWDGEPPKVLLEEYGYLMYQLIRCNNLRDQEGKKLTYDAAPAIPCLKIIRNDSDVVTSCSLRTKQGEKREFVFLTDSFVLADGVIYPIEPIGENYAQFFSFRTHFKEDMLETFLSVFFSYIDRANVDFEDYIVEYSRTQIVTTPALVIEKVDANKDLFLRLIHVLPGTDSDKAGMFDMIWQASLSVDHKIVLKRIIREALEPHAERLHKMLQKYAQTKQEKKDIYRDGDFFIIPEDVAGPFLLDALPTLLQDFTLLGAEKLREYKVKVVRPEMNISLSSGIDFLEGEALFWLEGESFSLKQMLSQYRKQKYVKLTDGNRAILDEAYMKRLERIFRFSKDGKKVTVSFFDLPEVEDMLNRRQEEAVFVRHREIFEGFNNLSSSKLALPKLQASLRPYQYEGFKWLHYLYTNNLGGCLADDMGLGKTIQTIALLARIYPKVKQPTLLVMPRSLLFNWQNELTRFAPQLTVYTYYGNNRSLPEAMKHQVILTTYALVRNDAEQFNKERFHAVILDESQNIKNINAQTTQSVLLLQAGHRFALSGTPIENNLTELYSLFRFLNPAMFGTADEFNRLYTFPIQRDNDKEVMQSLRRKIYPFMLRRLKKDVLDDLPDRIEQTLYVEMSDEQQAFYDQRRLYYLQTVKKTIAEEGLQKSQFVMFQALNELRRIASVPESLSDGQITSPKLDLLLDYLTEAVSNGHKVVLFFNYIAGLDLVGELLDANGIDFVSMTGSTRDRQSLVERFQSDPQCKVFLMTLKTGGVGLNLTAADTVFIFEPWWNKAAEEQAVNRLHRIGQTNKVLSYSIITRGSIEEKICLLQQRKVELFAELIGNDTSSAKNLTEEDIDYILGT